MTADGQGGFGFAVEVGRRPAKRARIWRAGLFWMVEAGAGRQALCSAALGVDEARTIARGQYPRAVVVVVSESEVG